MRTIHELVDNETYLDLVLDPKDISQLQERELEPTQVLLNGQIVNIWVRPCTNRELYENWESDEF
jgi:hypothetical protein